MEIKPVISGIPQERAGSDSQLEHQHDLRTYHRCKFLALPLTN